MAHSFFGRQPEIQDGPQFFFWCQPDIQDGLHYFFGVDLKFKIPQFFLCRPEFKMALNTGQCLTMVMGNEKLFL